MKVAYVRVSTDEQHTARQLAAVRLAGAEKVYEEYASGKDTARPQLQAMMAYVREGDIVVIESISRLGRSLADLIHIVESLQQKGVGIVSIKESTIDTTSPQGRLVFQIFAALSEFERLTIHERQKEGIAIAKAGGKYRGRKRIAVDDVQYGKVLDHWRKGNITATKAMKDLGLSKSTFYRRVRGG